MYKYIYCITLLVLIIACENGTVKKEYYNSGEIKTKYQVENGKNNGYYKEYYKSGTLKSEMNFKNGKINGLKKVYNEKGELLWDAEFTNDKIDGTVKEYSKKGVVISKGLFKEGKQSGKTIQYFEDGSVKIKSNYLNDSLDGDFVEYFPSGEILMQALYKLDTLLYFVEYSKDGDTIDSYRKLDIKLPKDPIYLDNEYTAKILFFGPYSKDLKYQFYLNYDKVQYSKDYQNTTSMETEESFVPKQAGIMKIGVKLKENGKTYMKETEVKVVNKE